jgi:predicted TIM-barrel fold metal-dependent hydrolase
MTRPCPGARAVTKRPSWRAPPGATDCHCHVFGPYDRYPLSPGRSYTPLEASIGAYLAMLDTIGLSRTVIVQPSVYGTDNAVTLDAVEAIGLGRARAVVVVDEGSGDAEVAAMAARGARGVRFNAVSGNGAPLDQLERLGARIAPLGWHVQLYTHADAMPDLEPVLRRLPVPVVVDHMGGVKAAAGGVQHPGFHSLLRLLERGAWVKLSGYRSSAGPPYADVAPMARALLSAASDRCVWGTDWPHPSLHDPAEVPDDGALLDALGEWAPDEAARRAVLVDNPARLYGFA